MNKFKLIDQVVIDQPIKADIKSDALDLLNRGKAKLRVQIDATHSGLLTNLRVYPGKHVKNSYLSYLSKELGGTSDYSVPILTHHEHKKDAIGRLSAAQFIQYKQGDQFDKDYLSPDYDVGKGSGVVRVSADITDPDAIEKIIDGRYLSVSSGQESNYLLCSICGDKLTSKECDHSPGRHYESNDSEYLCYAITGPLSYKEISFVNLPAQPSAKVIKFDWEGAKLGDAMQLLIPSMSRGKKSMISSMCLMDEELELDLLLGKDRSLTKTVSVVVPEGISKRISSSLEEQSTNEVTVVSVKPTASNVDKEQVAEPDKAKAPVPVSKDSKDVASSRPKTSVDKVDTKPMKSELDNKSKENRMDEKELNALKASLEDMTKKNQDLEKKNKDLTATVESNAIEVKKLNDQLATTKVEITKDYAKLVAHYRIVLDKPDTKGLDSDETKKAYIDSLGKRTLESLKDSLDDITLEFKSKTSATADKTVDTSKEKLPSPALHNDTAAGKEKSKLDTIFDGE